MRFCWINHRDNFTLYFLVYFCSVTEVPKSCLCVYMPFM
jgi:hypothetical protein